MMQCGFVVAPPGAWGARAPRAGCGVTSRTVRMQLASAPPPSLTRRALFQHLGAVVLAALGTTYSPPVQAEEETPALATLPRGVRGKLQPYTDLAKGYRMLRPIGWNEFDGTVESTQYDKKFQDIIQPLEFITVVSVPVKSGGKSVTDLGKPEEVGQKLAAKRNAKLVAANMKEDDGITYYIFEYTHEPAHQMTLLTVYRNKLFSVNASTSEKRWPRLEPLLRASLDSFVPHL